MAGIPENLEIPEARQFYPLGGGRVLSRGESGWTDPTRKELNNSVTWINGIKLLIDRDG